jgi:hypothetical protein
MRSAVTVLVPAVEPAVARHRRDLDASATWGVPAHVTVLFPFVAPEPDDGFRRLTTAVRAQFPDCAPYEGAHPDPIPHLTVGTTSVGSLEAVRRAEAEVSELLPIPARVERVHLMAGTQEPGSWQVLEEFPLTPQPRARERGPTPGSTGLGAWVSAGTASSSEP